MSELYNIKKGQVSVSDISSSTVSDAELDTLAGVTGGTATASKAVVLGGAKQIATLGAVTMGALICTTATGSGALTGFTTITGTGIGQFSQIKAREFVLAVGADGPIAITAYSQTVYFTKAGVVAATIADPTATTHDGVRMTFIATTAQANTLSNAAGSGFNGGGGGSDVATFGGAVGDNITIEAYQGKWYVICKTNVTLA